jgi:hypothetical protein
LYLFKIVKKKLTWKKNYTGTGLEFSI